MEDCDVHGLQSTLSQPSPREELATCSACGISIAAPCLTLRFAQGLGCKKMEDSDAHRKWVVDPDDVAVDVRKDRRGGHQLHDVIQSEGMVGVLQSLPRDGHDQV